ncbi:hypothetical protein BDP27DRAFT_1429119 [Rhodocollybia butyracea]|uniref:Uncharacterized protein n=1 Tax=Rhodocollybia butyracea TaxID=206335 RepID=A0A9P5U0D6_9AGAR|nr:hypothetical protein BDP27DRAFT_1429119 [Rhodocollybia butyracea]
MTPTEIQLVSGFGEQGFYKIFDLILSLTCYGAFMLGFIIALQSLTIGSWGRSQTVLLACLTTTFICFSWIVFDAGAVFLEVDHYAFIQTFKEQGITAQANTATKNIMIWQETSRWPSIINVSIVMEIFYQCHSSYAAAFERQHRSLEAFTLYAQSKLWRFILVILMIANISLNAGDAIWDIIIKSTEFSKSSILDWLGVLLSLIVNMVATVLFSYKAWTHHRYMEGVKGSLVRRGARAQKILNLLIESGIIFCTVQFVYVIAIMLDAYSIITTSSPRSPRVPVDTLFVTASACYPVAVIGLLHKDNKRLASTEISNAQNSAQSDDICLSTVRDFSGTASSSLDATREFNCQ